ncbi:MAG: hypothetical protein EF806_01280 [Candidatus Methanoliparum thermophilum]|uniref:SCP2 domain-containing protein n=1 Tax=Methanoliparum thermophilum TaxID=2491083 RepID=A0A520KTY9_METT2|nr:MAG: hypothetical protein EF806_01280 [Candidatus Methanoliparum thermophilum]
MSEKQNNEIDFSGRWWEELPWMEGLLAKEEPTAFQVLSAFVCNVILQSKDGVKIAGDLPPRVIYFVTKHPKRGEEKLILMLTPLAIIQGEPSAEPDIAINIDYYDFVRMLGGKEDLMDMVWSGKIALSGNTIVGMDLKDIIDASMGLIPTGRPAAWTIGVP